METIVEPAYNPGVPSELDSICGRSFLWGLRTMHNESISFP